MKDIEFWSAKIGISNFFKNNLKSIAFGEFNFVLMALVSDDLVLFDKVGAAGVYWSFPSKSQQTVNIFLIFC